MAADFVEQPAHALHHDSDGLAIGILNDVVERGGMTGREDRPPALVFDQGTKLAV
ncbi:hypothetical protein ACQPYE_17535 [Actinosynnema sp. CA-299493]